MSTRCIKLRSVYSQWKSDDRATTLYNKVRVEPSSRFFLSDELATVMERLAAGLCISFMGTAIPRHFLLH